MKIVLIVSKVNMWIKILTENATKYTGHIFVRHSFPNVLLGFLTVALSRAIHACPVIVILWISHSSWLHCRHWGHCRNVNKSENKFLDPDHHQSQTFVSCCRNLIIKTPDFLSNSADKRSENTTSNVKFISQPLIHLFPKCVKYNTHLANMWFNGWDINFTMKAVFSPRLVGLSVSRITQKFNNLISATRHNNK